MSNIIHLPISDTDDDESFPVNEKISTRQHRTLNTDFAREDVDGTNQDVILEDHDTSIGSTRGSVDDDVSKSREEYVASPARRAKAAAIWRTDLKDSSEDDDLYNDYDDYDDVIDYDGTPKVPRDSDLHDDYGLCENSGSVFQTRIFFRIIESVV